MKDWMNVLKSVKICLILGVCSLPFHNGFATAVAKQHSPPEEIIIENGEMRLVLGSDGTAIGLLHKPTGEECLEKAYNLPVFAITEERPYDNEQFLIYPAKSRIYPANSIRRSGNELKVGFRENSYTATIALNITDHYIGFTLTKLDYEIEKIGVKRPTEIDAFTLLQLPIKKRRRFGEWLNVVWDEKVAVNILATDRFTRIDAAENKGYYRMFAAAENEVKLMGVGAALITTETGKLLSCIDRIEREYNLPLGVESRRKAAYKYSYYELRNVTTKNIDEHIAFARKGGFKMMVIYYPDFSSAMGHFPWNHNFPGGMKDLQEITKKIKEAGMIPGFHIHYNKAAKNDRYVSPVPDARLNIVRYFTLAAPIDTASSTIMAEENPEGCTMEEGRRLLKIGEELISYGGYTVSPPFIFTGCKRGELRTAVKSAEKGSKFGLLDVDTWPLFIRFDQRTNIQEEVGKRIARIYNEAGFEFIYFDGAEDVHPPYWYTTSKAQWDVYKQLDIKPVCSEGAMKSHFGWHIITRGNAFDLFPPQHIREATQKYPMRAARYMADNFTKMNFGWNDYLAPDSLSDGMQPDMYEYICSRAAAWDCPIALMGKLEQLKKHPRTDDNLEVIKNWEEARIAGSLTDEQKSQLREAAPEHILLRDETGKIEIIPYQPVIHAAQKTARIKAFLFSKDAKTWVVYWHTTGSGLLTIPVPPDRVSLWKRPGERERFERAEKNSVVVPVDKRRFLVFDLPEAEVIALIKKSEYWANP